MPSITPSEHVQVHPADQVAVPFGQPGTGSCRGPRRRRRHRAGTRARSGRRSPRQPVRSSAPATDRPISRPRPRAPGVSASPTGSPCSVCRGDRIGEQSSRQVVASIGTGSSHLVDGEAVPLRRPTGPGPGTAGRPLVVDLDDAERGQLVQVERRDGLRHPERRGVPSRPTQPARSTSRSYRRRRSGCSRRRPRRSGHQGVAVRPREHSKTQSH